ncbi:hypothetical protein [Duganella sp. HH105]|uniref:hypothetical protein n=1 Tax=Duganella sp. HH105 TaxID=1781067 RepID=UPI000893C362|nr:hypothetical protein [Duganella sp. HH105]OEZ55637.1 hypothetical protein DUGA6_52910 [Duganella sp. HH105]
MTAGRAAGAMALLAALLALPASAADPLAACRLPEMQLRTDVGLGFPRKPDRLQTTGQLRFRVLFVDFSDALATVAPRDVLSIISPRAEQYFKAVSYGKLDVTLAADPRWIRMRKPSSDYHFGRGASFESHRAYFQEAIDLAGPAVDYAGSDAILVIANPATQAINWGPAFTARRGQGVQAGGREFINGATSGSDLPILGWAWFVHEIGHAMSLVDLAGPRPPRQLWHTYVGEFSAMGNPTGRAPEYLGWERWQLGWLDDAQVSCTSAASTTLTLTPLERAGGAKLALVPTGPNTALAVESRRAEGYDSKLPRAGLLVYTVDTRLSSHDGALRVQPPGDSDEQHLQALLAVGQAVTAGELTVTLLASDAHGDTFRIARAATHRD